MKHKLFALLFVLIALVLVIFSCEKDDKDTLPELPPLEALSMDFSDFSTMPDTTPVLKSSGHYTNFALSFVSVGVWNIATFVTMAIPIAAYTECLQQTPEYLGDNTWEWSFSVNILTIPHEARLVTKRIDNETYSAKMYVSKTGVFEDFLWFEGVIRYDATEADWTMYESPTNNVAWLSVEWEKDWEADTSSIIYTNIRAGDNDYGGYITYGITDDVDYDAYYSISGSEGMIDIKWNTSTLAGRISSNIFFDDDGWHCWDDTFMNVTCN
jgi:hypothetical protein